MSPTAPLRLFEATGIELEYMIVDRNTLSVRPIADELIKAEVGTYESEIERGKIAWSNELALHVIELKTNGPASDTCGLAKEFQAEVMRINQLLDPMNAMLMPSGMHPWMRPVEFKLWPHEYNPIYAAFDRIFDCSGHGWANVQSTHINLPFANDDEFGRLHTAIRALLPILPALAASSPVVEGRPTGEMDSRLTAYRRNGERIPSVTGDVIPEPILTRNEYETVLLGRIYEDLRPFDAEGTLRFEWVNARGCIARFDRMAIEIRVLDVQECPLADMAVAAATTHAIKSLVHEHHSTYPQQREWATDRLALIFLDTIREGDASLIHDRDYLRLLGYRGHSPCTAAQLWRHVLAEAEEEAGFEEWREPLNVILEQGCLARRILQRVGTGEAVSREIYRELCGCLADGAMFHAAP